MSCHVASCGVPSAAPRAPKSSLARIGAHIPACSSLCASAHSVSPCADWRLPVTRIHSCTRIQILSCLSTVQRTLSTLPDLVTVSPDCWMSHCRVTQSGDPTHPPYLSTEILIFISYLALCLGTATGWGRGSADRFYRRDYSVQGRPRSAHASWDQGTGSNRAHRYTHSSHSHITALAVGTAPSISANANPSSAIITPTRCAQKRTCPHKRVRARESAEWGAQRPWGRT